MFYSTYLYLCNEKGEAPTAVATKLGISRASVTHWKNGSIPSDARLHLLADYFGVTVESLLEDEQKEKPTVNDSELDNRITEKLKMLTPSEWEKVDAFLEGLIAARQA